jgi:hypothetical protein
MNSRATETSVESTATRLLNVAPKLVMTSQVDNGKGPLVLPRESALAYAITARGQATGPTLAGRKGVKCRQGK